MSTKRKRVGLDSLGMADEQPAAPAPAPVVNLHAEGAGEAPAKKKRAPNPNIKQLPAYIPLAAFRQLRTLRFEESGDVERSYNSYLLEGLDRVFAERGLKTIEELASEEAGQS